MENESDRLFSEWFRHVTSRTMLTDTWRKPLAVGAEGPASSGRIRTILCSRQHCKGLLYLLPGRDFEYMLGAEYLRLFGEGGQ